MIAECKLGRGELAMKLYDALLPYNQNDMIEIRESEPLLVLPVYYGKGSHSVQADRVIPG